MKKLVVAPVFWHARKERADVLGRFPLGKVGLNVTDYLSRRFGGRRKDGEKVCAEEAAELERELRRLFDNIHRTTITDIGAALGVHGGPGTLIVATQPYSRPARS